MNHLGSHATGGGPHGPSSADAAAATAARQGASLAFKKKQPPPLPRGTSRPPSGNGAPTATTLSAQNTGGSSAGLPDMNAVSSRNIVAARLQQLGHSHPQPDEQHHPQYLQPLPPSGNSIDPKSPSFIAATLAASRSVSPSSKARTPRRQASIAGMSGVSAGEEVDSGSIAPAGSLISMFEDGKGGSVRKTSPGRGDAAVRATEEGDELPSPVRSNKHRHTHSLNTSPLPPTVSRPQVEEPAPNPTTEDAVKEVATKPSKPPKPKPKPQTTTPPPQPSTVSRSQEGSHRPVQAKGSSLKAPEEMTPGSTKPAKPKSSGPPPLLSTISRPQPEPLPSLPGKAGSIYSPEREIKTPSKSPKPHLKPSSPPAQPSVVSRPQAEITSPKPTRASKPELPPPMPPPYPKTISRPSPQTFPHRSPGDPEKKDTPGSTAKQHPPAPPKPRGSTKATRTPSEMTRYSEEIPQLTKADRRTTSDTMSTDEVFVSALTSPEDYSSPPLPVSQQSTASKPHSPTRGTHTRKFSNAPSLHNLGLEPLTSAMMAGSLASRLTPHHTASSPPPPLPQRQKSPRLRQTMRGPSQVSDDENDRRKGHHRHKLRSGRHAHHEGARKRWREEIRARERKRYEAVWASNRGLLLSSPQSSGAVSPSSSRSMPQDLADCVANVVVREIWKRSRLPEDELAEVWDLVDREKRGILSRQEFVVGMWLIDQRLKGRKIPTKVSDSVWGSANGVTVTRPKGK